MSSDNDELCDLVYRSRISLLDHLESCGYNTTPYSKFSHKEVSMMLATNNASVGPPALHMELVQTQTSSETEYSPDSCVVAVYIDKLVKQKFDKVFQGIKKLYESTGKKKEYIILTYQDPIGPTFNAYALEIWATEGIRLRFFQMACIINNPLKHVLVPPHVKVPVSEEEKLLEKLQAKKSQLPIIRFHEDPVARMLGLLPKDIVKITRPSPTAGIYETYRLCVP